MSGAHIRKELRGLHSRKEITWTVDENGCWICTSHSCSNIRNGYPKICRNKVKYRLSRYMYEEKYGIIPKNMQACHRCDNPACINPDHIFLGTVLDNVKDMMVKGRGNKQKGEGVGTSKLTEGQVIEICKKLKNEISLTEIAGEYNVSKHAIFRIKTGRNWSWLTKEVM